jgi:hypothetical protein
MIIRACVQTVVFDRHMTAASSHNMDNNDETTYRPFFLIINAPLLYYYRYRRLYSIYIYIYIYYRITIISLFIIELKYTCFLRMDYTVWSDDRPPILNTMMSYGYRICNNLSIFYVSQLFMFNITFKYGWRTRCFMGTTVWFTFITIGTCWYIQAFVGSIGFVMAIV